MAATAAVRQKTRARRAVMGPPAAAAVKMARGFRVEFMNITCSLELVLIH
jgi:hypothetical protein